MTWPAIVWKEPVRAVVMVVVVSCVIPPFIFGRISSAAAVHDPFNRLDYGRNEPDNRCDQEACSETRKEESSYCLTAEKIKHTAYPHNTTSRSLPTK